MKTTTEMTTILSSGANLTIDGSKKTTTEITMLATTAKRFGGHLTVRNVGGKTTTELSTIGGAGKNHVTLDIS